MRTVLSAEQLKYVQRQKDMELASAHRKVKPYLKALESSSLAKFRNLTDQDVINLAHKFNTMDAFIEMCTSAGNVGDLGRLPIFKYEYITYDYGENINNIVSSVQTVDEPSGDILYKQILAIKAAGDVKAGQVLASAKKAPDDWRVKEFGINGMKAVIKTEAGVVDYSFSAGTSVVPNMVSIKSDILVDGTPVNGQDDGYGHISGYGIKEGTVNVETGNFTITLSAEPEADKSIYIFYTKNVEDSGEIASFTGGLARLPITCDTIALAGEYGIFQDFAIFKKIGKSADEDTIQDLTNMTNFQLFNRLMFGGSSTVMVDGVPQSGVVNCVPASHQMTWYRQPNTTSNNYYSLQAPEITRKLSQMDGFIKQDMGRGSANILVAGTNACADLEFLEGFESIEVGSYGAVVKGKYRNRVVICNPAQDANTIYGFYKGSQDFDAATYNATYMPITMSDVLVGQGGNLARRARVLASWASAGVSVPEGLASLHIEDSPSDEPVVSGS